MIVPSANVGGVITGRRGKADCLRNLEKIIEAVAVGIGERGQRHGHRAGDRGAKSIQDYTADIINATREKFAIRRPADAAQVSVLPMPADP